jgi:hypothetical protein
MQKLVLGSLVLSCCWALGACGGDGKTTRANPYPYDPDETTIIGAGGDPDVVATPDGDDCVQVREFVCVAPQDECGADAKADVIVDSDGNVIDTICYPTSGASVENISADAVPVEKTQNNSVVVLDGVDDGNDIEGDLSVDANNVVIYGESPDVSVIGGDLTITKNNAIIRGVRITGDVTIEFNNASFVFCVIEGNLTILGNNTTIAGCEVWGDVTLADSGNTILVSNAFADPGPFSAQGLICNDNVNFVDEDENGVIDEGELGDAVTCEG